ncbi:uncharacterized protein CcaverHIS019_0503800 [Cutaneotrichosporon cavernicola]|uniref:Mid2 domain-containing protein n=1 Tax=Cutaneotrichosporon cavernicola TaxID=279322 RepID=A0AA48L6C7_9TREE|nr:uncharacterized protein CcaverHIS019_0503800 [Cutaneotrichosporon cavernicola]BEI92752.1 hypothetical protein CcaverHIS019_0503800 [Cutaneotrichosporon cavernicola]BEJ00529.1 hypothetical protein CcaverHIS631_0503860 [Cutaneotrichosporon cavernicola]
MLPLVVVAVLAVSASAQGFTPNCFFNVSMTDNSPLVLYKPPSAWKSLFINSPLAAWQPGMMGQGVSAHGTFGTGPVINIEYPGTMAWAKGLVGNASTTPVRMDIDNIQQPYPELTGPGFLLTSNDNLAIGAHTVKIALDQSSTDPQAQILFQLFQSMCGVVAETTDPDKVICHTVEFAKDIRNTQVILTGNWQLYQQFGGVGGQPIIDYTSVVANNTPSVKLLPPKGSNYFYLNGTVGNVYGQYSVDIEPTPPYPRQENTFNASNSWDVPGELFYYTPLDPNVDYIVTVTGDQDITKYLGLNSFMYCDYALSNGGSTGSNVNGSTAGSNSTPSPTPGKKTNVGAIAGGVVGGVVAAAAIAALLFFLCRRNRKKDALDVDQGVFNVDDTVDATTPYQPPAVGGAKLAPGEESYSGHPQYGQTMYREPNMAEVGYGAGAGATPLLSPFGSDGRDSRHNSMQSGGPFGDSRQGSGPWPGSDGRQSFNGGSSTAGMGMAGYASGQGSAYDASSHSGYASGHQVSEKSVPAHQRTFRVEHEEDAGGLPMATEDVERLPPTYNPHWLETRTPQPGSLSSTPAGAAPAHKPDVVPDESQIPPAAAAGGSSQQDVVYPVEKS